MNDLSFKRRTDWPKDQRCALCGESIFEHRRGVGGVYCSAVAVRRVIDSGRTVSAQNRIADHDRAEGQP